MQLLKLLPAVGASLAAATGLAQAKDDPPRWRFSTGVEYSSGDFGGTQDTNVVYVPLSAGVTVNKFRFRATLPFLTVDGPADATIISDESGDGGGGGGGVDDGDPIVTTGDREESGIGDLLLSVSRAFYDLGNTDAYVDLNARVRLPTGDDEKGLGVGATDYGLGGEFGVSTKPGGAYVSAGYRFRGDTARRNRRDGAVAGIGGWLKVTKKTELGVSYDWRESSSGRGEDPQEAGGYIARQMTDQVRRELNGRAGLTDNTPDYAVGVRVSWRQKRR
jgi:hypothetical protein